MSPSLLPFSLSAMQLHIKCVQRRSCPKQDKKQQNIGTKSFYANTSYDFEYKKSASVNCQLKKTEKSRKGLCLLNASEIYDVGNL